MCQLRGSRKRRSSAINSLRTPCASATGADHGTRSVAASPPRSHPSTSTATQQRYTTDAVIDALSGDTVTLTHPPIPALKWPQMQMGFQLPPRSEQPRDLKAGDRLQIEFEMQDGDVPRITSLQRVAPEPRQ